MIKYPFFFARLCCLPLLCATAMAQEFDVDDADSLDFEAFHAEKKSSDKTTAAAHINSALVSEKKQQPLEIRKRYRLAPGNTAQLSVSAAIEALHQQMAQQCPQGWTKLHEWSVPVDQDFYLYYKLECL